MPKKTAAVTELAVGAECDAAEADASKESRAARKAAKRAARKATQDVPDTPTVKTKKAKKTAAKAEAAAAEEAAQEAGPDDAVPRKRPREGAALARKSNKRRKAAEEPDASAAASTSATPLGAKGFREAHQIIVDDGCPEPMETFDAAEPELGKELVKALRRCRYEAPTPIQAQAWPIALQGKDIVGVAKTGSGKTCGFLLPALARIGERGPAPAPKKDGWVTEPARPSVLLLAPTRELAQQIAGEAEKFGPAVKARSTAIYGGVGKGEQVGELRKGCDVLIATPGRLLDFCNGNEERGHAPSVNLEAVTYLVLDEADRMLDMGFEDDIRQIVGRCPKSGKPEEGGGARGGGRRRQTLFFTATWPKDVQRTAASLTSKAAVQVRIGQGDTGDKLTANASVKQTVMVIDPDDKPAHLQALIRTELGAGETAIVFSSMKARCDEVVQDLQRAGLGIWVRSIHSSKEQWDRDETLQKFRKLTASSRGSERGVLVATDVASRGLDIPGVAMVVVYDFGRALHSANNGGVESYVHRIGRTGRAGKTGRAFTFFTEEDAGGIELIELLRGANQEVPKALEKLAAMETNDRWAKRRGRHQMRGKGGGKGGKGGGKGKGKGKGKGGRGGSGGYFVRG